jgi:predicted nucleic acid-binding protein
VGLQAHAARPLKAIIDTCVWSQFLRRDPLGDDAVRREVAKLIRADSVQMLGAIRQELLSGARPPERFTQLKEYLRHFPNLPLDQEDDENAAQYYNTCRQHGVQGTATDLLICAVAIRYGFRILTTDTDFDLYAEHLPIKRHKHSHSR